jgi:putative membrane protein
VGAPRAVQRRGQPPDSDLVSRPTPHICFASKAASGPPFFLPMIDWTHWHNEPYLVGGLVVLGWLWAVLGGTLARSALPGRDAVSSGASLVVLQLARHLLPRRRFPARPDRRTLPLQRAHAPAPVAGLSGGHLLSARVPAWMIDPLLAAPGPLGPGENSSPTRSSARSSTRSWSGSGTPRWLYDWALQSKVDPRRRTRDVLRRGPVLLVAAPQPFARAAAHQLRRARCSTCWAVLIGMTPVFAYITFSQDILYPTYEYAPRLFADFSAGEDQLLAGVMMKTCRHGRLARGLRHEFLSLVPAEPTRRRAQIKKAGPPQRHRLESVRLPRRSLRPRVTPAARRAIRSSSESLSTPMSAKSHDER